MKQKGLLVSLAVLCLAGCGNTGAMAAGASSSGSTADYGQTKQMVLDILNSKDGQSALMEMTKNPQFKRQMAVSEADIAKAVENTVKSSSTQSFLAKQAQDPAFAETLAKAIEPQLVAVNKQLMKDPEYQKEMLVLLKSPEYTKDFQDLMETPAMRGAIMQIMSDALKTPSFKAKFESALKQAVSESIAQSAGQGQSKSSSGQGGEEGQGEQSGNDTESSEGGGGS